MAKDVPKHSEQTRQYTKSLSKIYVQSHVADNLEILKKSSSWTQFDRSAKNT